MALLEVAGLNKAFGGVLAVQDVSFAVESGLVYSVIGPNGAGKTTLFNLITGIYEPTSGDIRFDGRSIVGQPPHRLASLGIARTFQNLQICMNMSARENVMVGAHLALDRNLVKGMLRWPALRRRDAALREEAAALMRYVGLMVMSPRCRRHALRRASGSQAANPRLLFLDEPVAGLNPKETAEIDELIRRIADQGLRWFWSSMT
jgi:branched-chain amino acid transport system ATP-binding protein